MKRIIFLLFLLCSSVVLAKPIKYIVVFGDSLSDNGNLYEYMRHKLPKSPPYFKGRFTNGPVWIEYLSSFYFPEDTASHLLDYAFAGAAVTTDLEDDAIFTLKHEIDSYLLTHQNQANSTTLYVVWIGGNNYLTVPEDKDKIIGEVIGGIKSNLHRLVNAGAKHILVLNLPDLGKVPLAKEFDAEDALTYMSSRHNELLRKTVDELRETYPTVQWLHVDILQMLNEVINSPYQFGFSNVADTCYEAMMAPLNSEFILKMSTSLKMNTNSCEGYLFFDPVHPTSIAHKLVAQNIRQYLDNEGIKFKG